MKNITRQRRKSPAQIALETVMRDQEPATAGRLFLDQTGRPVVLFWAGGRWQTESADSARFIDQLALAYFERLRIPLTAKAIAEAQSIARAVAQSGGRQHRTYVRIAGNSRVVVHDLCNELGQTVEIRCDGYEVVTGRRTPFVRPSGLIELPIPDSGSQRSLFTLLHALLPSLRDEQIALLAAWTVAALNPNGPYYVLGLFGPKGCAKSTITKALRDIIDPQAAGLQSLPKDERDAFISAGNSYILAFDNVSVISPGISDALCRIASGGGYRTRKLYTDRDEVLFDVQRPIIFNGITNVITRDDLRDRSLIVTLAAVRDDARVTEEEFWGRYHILKPQILDAVYLCVSAALANVRTMQLASLPRMADAFRWVKSAERAMGLPASLLDKALELNRRDSLDTILDSSPIGNNVVGLVALTGERAGTATQLLEILREQQSETGGYNSQFPRTPHDFSVELARIEPALRERGIKVIRGRRPGGNRERIIVLKRETCA